MAENNLDFGIGVKYQIPDELWERIKPSDRSKKGTKRKHICLDKGYDYDEVREIVAAWGYTAHILTRGEEARQKREIPGYRARRWVIERTHSWLNRFRRILIRYEKKVDNYLAMLHFACAWVSFRAAGFFG